MNIATWLCKIILINLFNCFNDLIVKRKTMSISNDIYSGENQLRLVSDRRQYVYTAFIPERRSGMIRRQNDDAYSEDQQKSA